MCRVIVVVVAVDLFNMGDSVLHSFKKCSLNGRNNKLEKVERR